MIAASMSPRKSLCWPPAVPGGISGLRPVGIEPRRRTLLQPGFLLRGQLLLQTDWPEAAFSYLEMTDAVVQGSPLEDRYGWSFEAVDIPTAWSTFT